MIRHLRGVHRLASVTLVLGSAALLVSVPQLRPARTVAARLAEAHDTPAAGERTLRLEAATAAGRLALTVAVDDGRGTLRVLDARGTTLADVLLYHARERAEGALPADARLLGTTAGLTRERAALPSTDGWLVAYSLGAATLVTALPLGSSTEH